MKITTHTYCIRSAVLFVLASGAVASFAAHAADKNGVAPSAVSLPGGPGAIAGLGESFEADLPTGTLDYGIDIDVPDGVAGFAPTVSLQYSGGAGNGVAGFGWSVSVPFVQRKTELGIPRYLDGDNSEDDDGDGVIDESGELDTFVTGGNDDLIPDVDEGEPIQNAEFFRRVEGGFTRYRRVGDHWQADLRNGIRVEFGLTENARIFDPVTGHIFAWLAERITNKQGNVIVYSYAGFPGDANVNQRYVDTIAYGPGAPPWTNFHFVKFEYAPRSDWFECATSGFIVRTGMRLDRIVVASQLDPAAPGHLVGDYNGDQIPDALNYSYQLGYDPDATWSELATVAQTGCDGIATHDPVVFEYTPFQPPQTVAAQLIGAQNAPVTLMDSPWVELADMNADGAPDILKTDPSGMGPHYVSLNLGSSTVNGNPVVAFSDPIRVDGDSRAWNVSLKDAPSLVAYLADMDGDGNADLVYRAGNTAYCFPNTGAPGRAPAWQDRVPIAIAPATDAPPAPFSAANTESADIDFDKRMDVIQSVAVGEGAYYRVWLNNGPQGFSAEYTVPQDYGFMLGDPGVGVAEINGDRVPDIVRARPSGLWVTAGLGYGHFAPLREMLLPDATLQENWISLAELVDVNGDGLDDLVLLNPVPGELWLWINQGNYTFANRVVVTGLPVVYSENTAKRWADINGNGTTDLLYADATAVETPLRCVDIGALLGAVPVSHLLTRVHNGIGASYHVEYTTSTQLAIADTAAGAPWTDPLPATVYVAVETTVEDGLGNAYTTFTRYRDGYYDKEERQFRGFAHVVRTEEGDAGADAAVPPLVSRFTFDTGREALAMKGRLLHQSNEQTSENGGGVFSEADYVWEQRTVIPGEEDDDQQFPPSVLVTLDAIESTVRELGAAAPATTRTEYDYDSYANIAETREYGTVAVSGAQTGPPVRTTRYGYAQNLDEWILGKLSRYQLFDKDNTLVRQREYLYDDPTFDQANYGTVSKGNLCAELEWGDPLDDSTALYNSRCLFDEYGNAVAFLDSLGKAQNGVIEEDAGHFRSVEYDAQLHIFPISEYLYPGNGAAPLEYSAEYDLAFGRLLNATEYNGNVTTYKYDAFGVFTAQVKPGDSDAYPTVEYAYFRAMPLPDGGVVNGIETRILDKTPGSQPAKRDHYFIARAYVDGLGRTLLAKEEAEPDPDTGAPRVAMAQLYVYGPRGVIVQSIAPCYSMLAASDLDGLLAYEDPRAPGWEGLFHVANAGDAPTPSLIAMTLAEAPKQSVFYDATLRSVRTVRADGTQSAAKYYPLAAAAYDAHDTDVASPFYNTPTINRYDGLGRLIRTEESVRLSDAGDAIAGVRTWVTKYGYRVDNLLTSVTDSQGNVGTVDYDGFGLRLQQNDVDRGITTFEWDDVGNLAAMVDAKGQRTSQTFDGVNRILTIDFHDEALPFSAHRAYDPGQPLSSTNFPDIAYFYDEASGAVALGDGRTATQENLRGRVAKVVDLSGESYFSYDNRGRNVWYVRHISDYSHQASRAYCFAWQYDSADRIMSKTFPDGDSISFEYNSRRMLEKIHGGAASNAGATPYILARADYAPSGQRLESLLGNNVLLRQAFDVRGRHVAIQATPQGGPPVLDYRYTFDQMSNITRIDDMRPVSVHADGDSFRNTQSFVYDDLYRLVRSAFSFNAPGQPVREDGVISYKYDRIGNMLSSVSDMTQTENGLATVNLGAMLYGGSGGAWNRTGRAANDPPGPHALTAVQDASRAYPYDPNGNMELLRGMACQYDFVDHLVSVENDTMRARYVYDADGDRIVKYVWNKDAVTGQFPDAPSSCVHYVSNDFEIRENGQPVKYVFDGKTRLARVTGTLNPDASRVQRFHAYAGWNLFVMAVSAADAAAQLGIGSGAVESVYRYSAAGNLFVPVPPGGAIAAGTVFWLYAASETELAVTGGYDEPTATSIPLVSGENWLAAPTLETVNIAAKAPYQTEQSWMYDGADQAWKAQLGGNWRFLSDAPQWTAVGQPAFLRLYDNASIEIAPPEQRIHYYVGDHLKSSNLILDAAGNVVKEEEFYPYGATRTRQDSEDSETVIPEVYGYNQNEKDAETSLHCFGARYLETPLARFTSVDPLLGNGGLGAGDPQALNPYALARNNPIVFEDPSGRAFQRAGSSAGAGAMMAASSRHEIGIGVPNSAYAARTGNGRRAIRGSAFAGPADVAFAGMTSSAPAAAADIFTQHISDAVKGVSDIKGPKDEDKKEAVEGKKKEKGGGEHEHEIPMVEMASMEEHHGPDHVEPAVADHPVEPAPPRPEPVVHPPEPAQDEHHDDHPPEEPPMAPPVLAEPAQQALVAAHAGPEEVPQAVVSVAPPVQVDHDVAVEVHVVVSPSVAPSPPPVAEVAPPVAENVAAPPLSDEELAAFEAQFPKVPTHDPGASVHAGSESVDESVASEDREEQVVELPQ